MPRKRAKESTRQVYASIREDLYLAAKARATEMRLPLREFIERALELALAAEAGAPAPGKTPSVWDDEYLRMQAEQPLGSPVELAGEEAERVARAAFASESSGGSAVARDAGWGGVTRSRGAPSG